MKWNGFALALAAVALAVPALSRADTKSDIQKVYDKLSSSMLKGDLKGIMSTATPDFVMKEKTRTLTAKQALAEMEMMFKSGLKIKAAKMKVKSVTLKGNTAIVNSTGYTEAAMKMQDGKMHQMVQHSTSRDVLVKTPQGWKFKVAEMISDKSTMDGKPFDPSMMAPPSQGKAQH